MTEERAPYHAEQAEQAEPITAEELEAFTLPRAQITAQTLESVIIPAPAGKDRFLHAIMTDGDCYATFEELTHEEREIVLSFILRYAGQVNVTKTR